LLFYSKYLYVLGVNQPSVLLAFCFLEMSLLAVRFASWNTISISFD